MKSGNDVLSLFEQVKKNLRLNKAHKDTPKEEKKEMLKEMKIDYYRKLIQDLIDNKAYSLAQIIYGE